MSENRICILVTGASGQLGQIIEQEASELSKEIEFVFLTRKDLDITNLPHLESQLDKFLPQVIINAAAYTAVDQAESNKEKAFLINHIGVRNLAQCSKERYIKLIHISTDYVFDGESKLPYKEIDAVNPQTVYGQSKLAGERVIQEIAPDYFYIIRTSWLYSKKGHNFYNTMLRLAKEGKEISVVNDQWGSPTLANDLAKVLIHIAISADSSKSGIYHFSGEGACTWYAFAKAILDKEPVGNYKLMPVTTNKYTTAAMRPAYSVLDTSKLQGIFKITINSWDNSLQTLI